MPAAFVAVLAEAFADPMSLFSKLMRSLFSSTVVAGDAEGGKGDEDEEVDGFVFVFTLAALAGCDCCPDCC